MIRPLESRVRHCGDFSVASRKIGETLVMADMNGTTVPADTHQKGKKGERPGSLYVGHSEGGLSSPWYNYPVCEYDGQERASDCDEGCVRHLNQGPKLVYNTPSPCKRHYFH